MISQVATSIGLPQTISLPQANTGQSAPVVDIKAQRTAAAPVELAHQAVKAVEAIDIGTAKNAAEQINKLVRQFDRNLQFTVDEDTGTHVVKVIDTQSNEVIRQMPTEEMLAIAKALDKLQGLLIKDKV